MRLPAPGSGCQLSWTNVPAAVDRMHLFCRHSCEAPCEAQSASCVHCTHVLSGPHRLRPRATQSASTWHAENAVLGGVVDEGDVLLLCAKYKFRPITTSAMTMPATSAIATHLK